MVLQKFSSALYYNEYISFHICSQKDDYGGVLPYGFGKGLHEFE